MSKISIITINLNNSKGLENTLQSISLQLEKDFEVIIIDGGSTDNSLQIIHKFQETISKWLSEPDTGIYNAMNKGLLLATGDYILFLNSGDYFYSNESISTIINFMAKHPGVDIYYGNVVLVSNGFPISVWKTGEVDLFYNLTEAVYHQGLLCSKQVFMTKGNFSEKYKISGDQEWILRCFLDKRITKKYYKQALCCFEEGGISRNPSVTFAKESKLTYKSHFWIGTRYLALTIKKLKLTKIIGRTAVNNFLSIIHLVTKNFIQR